MIGLMLKSIALKSYTSVRPTKMKEQVIGS
jgi:hypothetical protein